MTLIDSNVLIDLRRGHPAAMAWAASAQGLVGITVTGIVLMEVLFGCRNRVEMNATRTWLTAFDVLWPTSDDVAMGCDLLVQYRLSHGLDIGDAILAAMALRLNARVLTLNLKHFRAISNLEAVAPYTRA